MKLIALAILALTMGLSGCNKANVGPDADRCFSGKAIKSVKNQKGLVGYDPLEEKYVINASIPGTYDSQDTGFVCNMPESLRKEGLVVTFSGKYYSYKEDRKPMLGGQEYYFLDVTKFRIIEE